MHSRTPTRTRTLIAAPAAGILAMGGLVAAGAAAKNGRENSVRPIPVSDTAQLKDALAAARPGDTIELADGTYRGGFVITASGTSNSRITLTGSPKAVLTASDGYGFGLHLDGASYWTVRGITVTGGRQGITIERAESVTVDSVTVQGGA
jgi:nitrous oxidase accessory protein NosD